MREIRCGIRGFENDTKLANAGVGVRSFMVQLMGTVMKFPVVSNATLFSGTP